jgi:[ribosomal protein S5]-alanine N-acetyltransferase
MNIIHTERLTIRPLTLTDTGFILRLLNEPSWIKYIGDKGVHTEEDARHYLETGPLQMYEEVGVGLQVVTITDSQLPIGLCGLIKRPQLEDIDLGYAYLPEYTNKGYAYEAAQSVVHYGKEILQLDKLVAFTTLDNTASGNLLLKLGFTFDGIMPYENKEVKWFTKKLFQV